MKACWGYGIRSTRLINRFDGIKREGLILYRDFDLVEDFELDSFGGGSESFEDARCGLSVL